MMTGIIGRNLIFLPNVESTNSYAMQLLKNVKPKEGTVVYAGAQSHGRGQRAKVWDSDPGRNVTMSVILFPCFLELKKQYFLYQIVALACYDTIAAILNQSQFDIKIKWPNDILINSKKVAGILIESNLMDNKILSTVIGIGLNVNQKLFKDQSNATSLALNFGQELDSNKILASVCNKLSEYYKFLKTGKTEPIQLRYESLMFGLEEWKEYLVRGKSEILKVKGVGPTGLLLLENMQGTEHEFDNQELRWIY